MGFIGGLFDSNEGELRKLRKIATRVNQLEADLQKKSDTELAESTTRFRERLAKGETLDDILPGLRVIREAAKRPSGSATSTCSSWCSRAHKAHRGDADRRGKLCGSLSLYERARGKGAPSSRPHYLASRRRRMAPI